VADATDRERLAHCTPDNLVTREIADLRACVQLPHLPRYRLVIDGSTFFFSPSCARPNATVDRKFRPVIGRDARPYALSMAAPFF